MWDDAFLPCLGLMLNYIMTGIPWSSGFVIQTVSKAESDVGLLIGYGLSCYES